MNTVLIKHATIFDATGAAPFGGDVLVDGNRVAAVSRVAGQIATGDSQLIDGTGLFLMPGLTEGHGHLSFDNITATADLMTPPPEEQTLATARNANHGQAMQSDDVRALADLGFLALSRGMDQHAMAIFQGVKAVRPQQEAGNIGVALVHLLRNEIDQAIKVLRQAVELGYRDFRFMREDHDLDSIRNDPRFRQLLREYENQL